VRTGLGVGAALLVGIASTVFTVPAAAAIRPAGDPGGRILKELAAVRSSIPARATEVRSRGEEPVMTDSCTSTIPGVEEYVSFSSRQPAARVESEVSADMQRSGWGHRSASGGRWYADYLGKQVLSQNEIVRWTRRLPQGPAGAQLTVAIPVSGWHPGDPLAWSLAASAKGVDEPNRHCGSP